MPALHHAVTAEAFEIICEGDPNDPNGPIYPNPIAPGEFGEVRPRAHRRWVLDPIDGTKTFVRGVPLWGTLVGVVEGHDVVAGAVYIPALGELVAAGRGCGAWHNGARCRVSDVTDLAMKTCGGAAFSKQLGLERIFRDARAGWVMAPTVDHLLEFSGRALTGLPLFG